MLARLSRFISCLYLHLQRRILIKCPWFGFTVFKKPYWWSLTICASCIAFRHGLYHPYELLEKVKAHWLQVVFPGCPTFLPCSVPSGSDGSLVQWKCVLACWQCPRWLLVSHVLIKSLPLLSLCQQSITCLLTHPSVCREICRTALKTRTVAFFDKQSNIQTQMEKSSKFSQLKKMFFSLHPNSFPNSRL